MQKLQKMMQSVMQETIATSYPHMKLPAVLLAKVTSCTELQETHEQSVVIRSTSGSTSTAVIVSHWYECTLQIVDQFGNVQAAYPELPGVRAAQELTVGAFVAIALPNGELNPVIVGGVVI